MNRIRLKTVLSVFFFAIAAMAASMPTSAQSCPPSQKVADNIRGNIVALNIDIALDQGAPGANVAGQHHEARIFYNKTQIDPVSHRVPVLHQQHTGNFTPKHLDPLEEPMDNAWLDLSGPVIRYHMAASPAVTVPEAYTVLFDEKTMRMTIRQQGTGNLILSGSYTVDPKPITGPEIDDAVSCSEPARMPWAASPPMTRPPAGAPGPGPQSAAKAPSPGAPGAPNIVTLSLDVELDTVSPQDAAMYHVGGHDRDRIAYDSSKVDPVTHRVPVSYLAHYIGGHWGETTPTDASSLDLSSKPYKLNFVSAVTHGAPIVVLFDGEDQRMVILSRPDFKTLIAGKYVIDPAPLTPEQIAAPPPNASNPDAKPNPPLGTTR